MLAAACPGLAAGIAAGQVSAEHARIVLDTLAKLPGRVREQSGAVVEAEMATAAAKVTPADLEGLAAEVMVRADPEGTLRDIDHAHKQRGLRLWKKRGQAGFTLHADLDQATGEAARVVLDAWSKPARHPPPPVRTAPQPGGTPAPHHVRMHDAFGDVLQAVLNSGDLPACGGTPAATIWHIPDQVLRERYGFAISEHGTLLPIQDALHAADQSALYLLIENSQGVPLYLGRTTRIATPGQTAALAARDQGCSFPGCDRPPSHCQRHHITALGQRRPHQHRQPHPALRPPPPRTHQTRLGVPHVGRSAALATTRLARPPPRHPPQHPTLHPAREPAAAGPPVRNGIGGGQTVDG